MKEKLKKKAGITLIALVLTIIVLLILAGVSIATLTGENGILTKAQTAKTETEKASEGERKDIEELEELLSNETVVEQVTDKNPGQLEEENEEKVINSIEDLVVFASKVTGGETYEGKTVKLGLSLDFNSVKSYVNPYRTDYEKYGYNGELKTLLTSGEGFKPIGKVILDEGDTSDTIGFKGTFDGQGNKIYNLRIEKNVKDEKLKKLKKK